MRVETYKSNIEEKSTLKRLKKWLWKAVIKEPSNSSLILIAILRKASDRKRGVNTMFIFYRIWFSIERKKL